MSYVEEVADKIDEVSPLGLTLDGFKVDTRKMRAESIVVALSGLQVHVKGGCGRTGVTVDLAVEDASIVRCHACAAMVIGKLRRAISEHRRQKADDRCIEDDDKLYAALGDGVLCDRSVGSKEAMLKNCARFIERRCIGGEWPTYAELEAKVQELEARLKHLDDQASGYPE